MKKRLLNNIGMKLIALLAAIVIWLIIVNINDVVTTKTITLNVIEVNAEDLGSVGKTYEVVSGNVATARIRGRASVLKDLDASDFTATADLSNLSITGAVWVDIQAKDYVRNVEIEADNNVYKVVTENLITKQFSVSVRTRGNVASGYYLGEVKATPNMISITGSETKINSIGEIVVELDVSGYASNVTEENLTPLIYSTSGELMDADRLTMDTTSVDVNITMLRTKTIPVTMTYTGQVEEGYTVVSRDAAVSDITIAGAKADLDEISSLEMECDITGLTEQLETTILYKNFLPDNISLTEGDRETSGVAVNIVVEPILERTIEVPFDQITLEGAEEQLDYHLSDGNQVSVVITGAQSQVSELVSSDLNLSIDVTGMSEGTYRGVLVLDNEEKTYALKVSQTVRLEVTEK